MSSESEATGLYSISALARLCGRDRATVVKCLKGIKPVEQRAKEKLYALAEAVPAIVAGADAEYDAARLRKLQHEGDLKEIELKREQGEVVEVKEVRAYAQALFRGLQQRMAVRLPRDIAPQLYKAESPAQITEVMQREVGRIFNELRDDHTRLL
jgi:phage terminase Nu1 subunit (DNA packaging protein)